MIKIFEKFLRKGSFNYVPNLQPLILAYRYISFSRSYRYLKYEIIEFGRKLYIFCLWSKNFFCRMIPSFRKIYIFICNTYIFCIELGNIFFFPLLEIFVLQENIFFPANNIYFVQNKNIFFFKKRIFFDLVLQQMNQGCSQNLKALPQNFMKVF